MGEGTGIMAVLTFGAIILIGLASVAGGIVLAFGARSFGEAVLVAGPSVVAGLILSGLGFIGLALQAAVDHLAHIRHQLGLAAKKDGR